MPLRHQNVARGAKKTIYRHIAPLENSRYGNVFMVGDFNWKKQYHSAIPQDWAVMEHGSTIKSGTTAPTRCVCFGGTVCATVQVERLPGIPHHCAVSYGFNDCPCVVRQETRLKRVGDYVWSAPAEGFESSNLVEAADKAAQRTSGQTLPKLGRPGASERKLFAKRRWS